MLTRCSDEPVEGKYVQTVEDIEASPHYFEPGKAKIFIMPGHIYAHLK